LLRCAGDHVRRAGLPRRRDRARERRGYHGRVHGRQIRRADQQRIDRQRVVLDRAGV
jgi:hypothetical protein